MGVRGIVVAAVWVALLALGSQAHAAPPAKGSAADQIKDAEKKLGSDDLEIVRAGFSALVEAGGARAAAAALARIKQGLPPQLLQGAIDSLVALKQPSALPVLLELSLHRRWQVREQALLALASLRARSAQSTILYALDDPSPEVRRAAARALAEVGDARALPSLRLALERDVQGAAEALAKLGTARDVELVLGRVKDGDFSSVSEALGVALVRRDLPALTKRAIVKAASEASSESAKVALHAWQGSVGKAGDKRLADEIGAAFGQAPGASTIVATRQGANP
jgi:HEAT repeat protein